VVATITVHPFYTNFYQQLNDHYYYYVDYDYDDDYYYDYYYTVSQKN